MAVFRLGVVASVFDLQKARDVVLGDSETDRSRYQQQIMPW
jgi:hypothetical protein